MDKLKKRRNTVLVVDDEADMRELLMEFLRSLGYDVTCAANGRDALQMYQRRRYDVIISDLVMRPIDGLELLNKIKTMDSHAVFIMITGYPSIGTTMEAIKKGARDYITKPFNLDEVKMKIERALLEQSLQGRIKNIQGVVWALVFSIPAWLILGIIFAKALMK